MKTWLTLGSLLALTVAIPFGARAALRHENFDREPPAWEGVNHRSKSFGPKTVEQNFGYSSSTTYAGGQAGEVGGRINPAGEPAFYAHRLLNPLNLNSAMNAEGRMYVARGSGHCLMGFFNTNSLNEWRTPNTLVARVNSRGDAFHCHLEYCTSKWRASAGVIGEIVAGQSVTPIEIPVGKVHTWKMAYDPNGGRGNGLLTFSMAGATARCEIEPEHRRGEGLTVTHFGLLPVLKTWDGPGEIWLDDVHINGAAFDFTQDPKWDALNNRRTYVTSDTRPKFDFGWSPTSHAGGQMPGELGGLIFRGDCREPARMACYGDRLARLTLHKPLEARGKVSVLRAISDSTASIGFYHSRHSMQTNPSPKSSIPMDYLGINIEGPSGEGFFFYPVYRTHSDDGGALGDNGGKSPRIFPNRKVHDWFLRYDPNGANGNGQITVGLDDRTCTLDLSPGHKAIGAAFDRFGICTPWIDGNSVTVYFDDLSYTASQDD
ncbi:MAG: hypothetical protein L0Y58_12580 [Verrucomicrobia subdivision 3 bacterium]|nr:hypothetical protein [Limisphaerales bacterium]